MEGVPGVIVFPKVSFKKLKEDLSQDGERISNTEMRVWATHKIVTLSFPEADNLQLEVNDVRGTYRTGPSSVIAKGPWGNALIQLSTPVDCNTLWSLIEKVFPDGKQEPQSNFDRRTAATSAQRYFETYGTLAQQQIMLQDYPRTSTYQKAFLQNKPDFAGKVVLDVGAGTGILSLFCAQAGAAKVYAVEASNMAIYCKKLVANNKLDHIITVMEGKVEEVLLPEKVDVIVSEPMGYLLFNERMIESYLHAKKFLKPGGKMFPTEGNVYIAPFMDETLYLEQLRKTKFWSKTSFHGVDLSSLQETAAEECLSQPVKGVFEEHVLLAKSIGHNFDFLTTEESGLKHIVMPLHFEMASAGSIHGLAFWFDVHFIGSVCTVVLSTSPSEPLTHWYQIRCLLKQPLPVEAGAVVTGTVIFKANDRQSYDMDLQLTNTQTSQTLANIVSLKNVHKKCMAAPPTSAISSSTDDYVEPGGISWN